MATSMRTFSSARWSWAIPHVHHVHVFTRQPLQACFTQAARQEMPFLCHWACSCKSLVSLAKIMEQNWAENGNIPRPSASKISRYLHRDEHKPLACRSVLSGLDTVHATRVQPPRIIDSRVLHRCISHVEYPRPRSSVNPMWKCGC